MGEKKTMQISWVEGMTSIVQRLSGDEELGVSVEKPGNQEVSVAGGE